jgi:hypothetical protein
MLAVTATACSSTAYAVDEQIQKPFICTLTDTRNQDKSPGAAKDTFAPNTPTIYILCDSDQVKKGDNVKTVLTAIDTHKAAPDNYIVGEKVNSIANDIKDNEYYTVDFYFSKPDNGWPVGTYKIDLFLNEKLTDTYNFSVK